MQPVRGMIGGVIARALEVLGVVVHTLVSEVGVKVRDVGGGVDDLARVRVDQHRPVHG